MIYKKITSFIFIFILSFQLSSFMVFALSPLDISNQVFFFDAQDINGDGDNSNEPINNSLINTLIDKFNSNTGSQIISSQQPIYKTGIINNYPSLYFDGINDLLNLKDNLEISVGTGYTEKSYVMIIKTSDDINSFQTIYDEATKEKGFAFQIENGHLYAGTFNTINWEDTNRTIDLGVIEIDKIYTIIFVYSKTGDFIKTYLNGELKGTLNSIEEQNTHGACTFETSFNCNMYSTGGTLALGATKNDILKLSNSTTSTGFELNYFKGYIGEISSYNYALNNSEIDGLHTYLFDKWGIDTIAPTLSGSNISTGQILPGGNNKIEFYYSDETGGSGINTNSAYIKLEKWDGSNWINNSNISQDSINITKVVYGLNNIDYGKYKISFHISDNAGNTSSNKEIIFYIDKPQLIISTGSINIGTLNNITNTFGNDLQITVKTIGAPFNVKLKRNKQLTYNSGETIQYYNGTNGLGYDKNNNGGLSNFNNDIILSNSGILNTNGDLNTYIYTLKMGAIIQELQFGGNYNGKIDFIIELDY